MFDVNGVTINVIEILDPLSYPGAEYFNWFFTLITVFALLCFGIQMLVRLISRS